MKKIRLFAFCAFAFFSCAALCSALPKGYGSIELGMSVDEVKSELKKNTDFGYRGDRDVSLSPKTKQVLIETDASKNAYSFFTSLSKKYGNPSSISPKRSAWQDDSIIMSLERPLTLKYIDNAKFQKMLDEGNVQKTIEEKSKDEFLESL